MFDRCIRCGKLKVTGKGWDFDGHDRKWYCPDCYSIKVESRAAADFLREMAILAVSQRSRKKATGKGAQKTRIDSAILAVSQRSRKKATGKGAQKTRKRVTKCAKCGKPIGKAVGSVMDAINAPDIPSAISTISNILAQEAYRCEKCRCVICQGCVILGGPQLCPKCGHEMG